MYDILTGDNAPWMAAGKCVGATRPDDWFPVNPEVAEREAPRLCGGCPVRIDCIQYALERPELEGIWGGSTDRQRSAMRGNAHTLPVRIQCGSAAGVSQHKRRGEDKCDPCKKFAAEYKREWNARKGIVA